MASASDFKVKKGLQVQGGDINFSNAQHADIRIDAAAAGTNSAGKNLTISSGGTTGDESTSITLKTTTAGSSGTGTNSPSSKIVIGGAGVTTFTAGGDLDIGSHGLTALSFTSDITTGTGPPFTVASTANVANLNASSLGGATFAAPGAIGGTTAAAGTFTTLTATTSVLGTLAGDVDHSNYNSTNVDIDSGAIDGTTIGAASAAAGTFTALTGTSLDMNGAADFSDKLTLDKLNANSAPGADGHLLHIDAVTLTDATTNASGTVSAFNAVTIDIPTLAASNSSITTTTASTLKIGGAPAAGNNQTLTNSYALNVATGETFLGDNLTVDRDITVNGGDINFGNSGNANMDIADTAHDTAGKSMTIAAGSPDSGTTNNIAGGGLILQGGRGKGTGVGGSVTIQSAPATTSGSSNNSFAGGIEVKGNHTGDIVLSTATAGDENDEIVQVRNRTLQIRPKRHGSWNGGAGEVVALYIGDDGYSSSAGDMDSDRMVFYDLDEYSWRAGLNVNADTGTLPNPIYEIGVGRTVTGNTTTAAPTQTEFSTAKTGFAMDHNGHILRIGSTNPSSGDFLSWDNSNSRWVPAGLTSAAISTSTNTDSTDNTVVTYSSTGGGSVDSSAGLTFDGKSLVVNTDTSGNSAENLTAVHVDFDRTVANSGTAAHNDIGIDVDVTSASLGISSLTGIDIDAVGAASGTSTAIGLDVSASGADANYAAIFRSGRVGVGTVTPTVPLDVVGASKFEGDVTIQGTENAAGNLYLKADQGDDAADEWKVSVGDGGSLTIGNDIASAGTFVSQLTLTPHATQAESTTRVEGELVVDGNLTVSGDQTVLNTTAVVAEDKTIVLGIAGGMEDATYARTSGGAVTVTSTTHGIADNEYVYVSNMGNSISDGVYQISSPTTHTFVLDGHGTSGAVSAGATMQHSSANVTEATADGAGIFAPGTSLHSIKYTTGEWTVSDGLTWAGTGTGNVTGNVTGNLTGSVLTASQASITTTANLTTVGALDAGSITSNFTSIDVGSGAISTTGTLTGGPIVGTGLSMDSTVLMDYYKSGSLTSESAVTMFDITSSAYSAFKVIVSVYKAASPYDRSIAEYLITTRGDDGPTTDSDDLFMTEYAIVETGGAALATVTAVKDGTSTKIKVAPASTTSTYVRAQITQFVI